MAINPIGPRSGGHIETRPQVAAPDVAAARARADAAAEAPSRHDRVEISDDALRLSSHVVVGSDAPAEIPERMLDIGKRLAQDFYEQPAVQETILAKLKKDL